jgi:hypothetical protein
LLLQNRFGGLGIVPEFGLFLGLLEFVEAGNLGVQVKDTL